MRYYRLECSLIRTSSPSNKSHPHNMCAAVLLFLFRIFDLTSSTIRPDFLDSKSSIHAPFSRSLHANRIIFFSYMCS